MKTARPVTGPLFIRHKDIMRVCGIQRTASSRLMAAMRHVFRKRPHQRVTVAEFAEYIGVPPDDVLRRMQ